MNRRQFIQRVTSITAGLLTFDRPVLRGETKEMPITLGGRSVFAPLWDGQGIKSVNVRNVLTYKEAEIEGAPVELECIYSCYTENNGDVWESVDGGMSCKKTKNVYDEYWSRHFAGLAVGIEDDSLPDKMGRLLAANPEMNRERAFFLAIMEIAESTL